MSVWVRVWVCERSGGMDSRLLTGPGMPTPEPAWNVSSIGPPHRLLDLVPLTTAVSKAVAHGMASDTEKKMFFFSFINSYEQVGANE